MVLLAVADAEDRHAEGPDTPSGGIGAVRVTLRQDPARPRRSRAFNSRARSCVT
jgi:hypothetical protein